MDDDQDKGYAWETEYERTWEALQEDESGSLQTSIQGIVHRAKRKHLEGRQTNVRLGMMRHVYVVVDLSAAMTNMDLKPSRAVLTLKLLEGFVTEFFDQNPISQLGIMITMNKRAEKSTDLSGNPNRHIEKLKTLAKLQCSGEPSLQNTLEMALQTLRHLPSHTSREVLIIMGSLTTCDPSNIKDTITRLSENKVRCSVIGLAAEVKVCKTLCASTGGQYDVILDEHHFKDLLNKHVTPPPSKSNMESSLIRMGFPFHRSNESGDSHDNHPSMCMCHLDNPQIEKYFSCTGYYCPQCKSKYCELPVECKACGLTLVSAPHLARSYRHLFPLPPFKEIPVAELSDETASFCFACQTDLSDSGTHVYQCDKCSQFFCNDCDTFIHDSLQTCPNCASRKG